MLFRVRSARNTDFHAVADNFHQSAVITHGIAARHARRQASSENAPLFARYFPVMGFLAKKVLEDEGITIGQTSKL